MICGVDNLKYVVGHGSSVDHARGVITHGIMIEIDRSTIVNQFKDQRGFETYLVLEIEQAIHNLLLRTAP